MGLAWCQSGVRTAKARPASLQTVAREREETERERERERETVAERNPTDDSFHFLIQVFTHESADLISRWKPQFKKCDFVFCLKTNRDEMSPHRCPHPTQPHDHRTHWPAMFTPPPDVLRDSFFQSPESLALSSVLAEWCSWSPPCLGVNVDIVI